MFNPDDIFNVVVDIIGDFASNGKIASAVQYDPVTGDTISGSGEHPVNYVIESYPVGDYIDGKIKNGDAKVTLTAEYDFNEDSKFIDNTGAEWAIISIVKTEIVNLKVMYEIQVRK